MSPSHPTNTFGVPLIGLDTAFRVNANLIVDAIREIYADKIILIFKCNQTIEETSKWLIEYNKEATLPLKFCELLVNLLFVVLIASSKGVDINDSIDMLISESPLRTLGKHAYVNRYFPKFDPLNPHSEDNIFCQLVTVLIKKGSPLIYKFLKDAIKLVGKLIDHHYAPRTEQHQITTLVEIVLP